MILIDKIEYARRKSVGITVRDGAVAVRAPRGLSRAKIQDIVDSKAAWINAKLSQEKTRAARYGALLDYREYMFLGKNYAVPRGAQGADGVKTFLKDRAVRLLPERTLSAAAAFGLRVARVKVIRSTSKWGNCNTKGVVSLNWRLVMLPEGVIDYVVAHELAHLSEMNHSQRFWRRVAELYPTYETAKKYLKEYGFLIKLFK